MKLALNLKTDGEKAAWRGCLRRCLISYHSGFDAMKEVEVSCHKPGDTRTLRKLERSLLSNYPP